MITTSYGSLGRVHSLRDEPSCGPNALLSTQDDLHRWSSVAWYSHDQWLGKRRDSLNPVHVGVGVLGDFDGLL